MKARLTPWLVASLLAVASPALCAANAIVPYTGRLVEGGLNVTGVRQLGLALVDSNGAVVWSNSPMVDNAPGALVSLQVSGGHYQVELGNAALPNMAGLDSSVLATPGDLVLRVWVAQEGGAPVLVSPDLPVRHAFKAVRAEMLGDRSAGEVFGELNLMLNRVDDLGQQHGLTRYLAEYSDQRLLSLHNAMAPGGTLQLGGALDVSQGITTDRLQLGNGGFSPTRLDGHFNEIGGFETRFRGNEVVFDTMMPVFFSGSINVQGVMRGQELQLGQIGMPDGETRLGGGFNVIGGYETRFIGGISLGNGYGQTRLDGVFNEIGGVETRFRGDRVSFDTMLPVFFERGLDIAGTASVMGALDVGGTARFQSKVEVPVPVDAADAANRGFVEISMARGAQGLAVKASVRVASKDPVDLASTPESIDGITLATGDRVLLLGQTDPAQNGVYVFQGTGVGWVRGEDCDDANDFAGGAHLFVREGSLARAGYVLDAPTAGLTVGLTPLNFARFTLDPASNLALNAGLNLTGGELQIGSEAAPGGLTRIGGFFNEIGGYDTRFSGGITGQSLRLMSPFGMFSETRLDGHMNEIGGFETRFRGERVSFDTMLPVNFSTAIEVQGEVRGRELRIGSEFEPDGETRFGGGMNLVGGYETRFAGSIVLAGGQTRFDGMFNEVGGMETRFQGDISTRGIRINHGYGPGSETRLDGIMNEISGFETRFRGERVSFDTMLPVSFMNGMDVGGTARFTSTVEVPDPVEDGDAVNRRYVETGFQNLQNESLLTQDRVMNLELRILDQQQRLDQQDSVIQQQQQLLQQLESRLQALEQATPQ